MLQHSIIENDLNKWLDSTQEDFQNIARQAKRGYLTDDEVFRLIDGEVQKTLGDFLNIRGFHYGFSSKGWERFVDEYRLWSAGKEIDSTVGEPWFYYDNLDDPNMNDDEKGWLEISRRAREYNASTLRTDPEAASADKAQFFRILDAFDIPLEYFKPVPENIPTPNRHFVHMYTGCTYYTANYLCVDDGGLSSETDPVGKQFCLKNNLGLQAHLTIKEVRTKEAMSRYETDEDDSFPLGKYLAEGWIEGYTTARIRTVVIRTDGEGRIVKFGFACDRDDEETMNTYPLWQECFELHHQKYVLWRNVIINIIQSIRA